MSSESQASKHAIQQDDSEQAQDQASQRGQDGRSGNDYRDNVDAAEVAKFEALASRWWDKESEFKPLHEINPLRLDFIDARAGLAGKRVIDVGCGGGLLCEPLSRLGAEVTGIDAGKNNIEVAKRHSKEKDVSVNYKKCLPEDVVKNGNTYDVVISLEVIEHVINAEDFVKTCCQLLNPGGVIIFSTLNRTVESLALAKLGAEFIFRLVPVGTHSWRKLIYPCELLLNIVC